MKRIRETQPQQSQYPVKAPKGSTPATFEPEKAFTASDPEADFVKKLENVAAALGDDGVEASVEYPGCLLIHLPDDTELWFGDVDGPVGYTHVRDGEALDGKSDGPEPTATSNELYSYVSGVVAAFAASSTKTAESMKTKAKKLVERLLAETPTPTATAPTAPVDEIVEWTPCVFDGYSNTPEPPSEVCDAVDSGEITPEVADKLSTWLNANWQDICDCEIEGESAPENWRGMAWTPELAARVLNQL